MTYQEATEYLFNTTPLFQNVGKDAYKAGLENTLELDRHFGHPHRQFRTVHIGGTNGKGSCSHTLAAILQEAGYRTGLYTSPHLTDFRERIRVNGSMIPESRVVSFIEQERAFFEPLHPSFFELTTALAFKYFAEEKVDVAIIEVGLGGRLDCTNIIRPDLSVITNISFDHMQFLGNTLEAIAREKAGIIKTNTPVVVGESTEETRNVFVDKAQEMNAPIVFAEDLPYLLSAHPAPEGYTYRTEELGEFTGRLGGWCQEKNTRTILAAVDELRKQGYRIEARHIRRGFADVCRLTGLRGRWQILDRQPDVICDTGHNVGGMAYISRQLMSARARRVHIIIGMVNDKDIKGVLRLLPAEAVYYFTKASVRRALDEHQLRELGEAAGLKGESYPDVRSAFGAAKRNADAADLIFVGGSTFVVADFLAFYEQN